MPRSDFDFDSWYASKASELPRTLYRYFDAVGAIVSLATSSLRMRSPLAFNDPFDSQWDTLWQVHTDAFRRIYAAREERLLLGSEALTAVQNSSRRSFIQEIRQVIQSLPPERRRDFVRELIRDDDTSDRSQYAQQLHDMLSRSRVLCLAEAIDCPLMWGHYADKHRGAAIEFDIIGLSRFFKRPIERVQYPTSLNLPRLIDEEDWIESRLFERHPHTDYVRVAQALTLTKDPRWAYEREWRYFWQVTDHDPAGFLDQRFPRAFVTRVFLGCRIAKDDAARIRAIVADLCPRVEVVQTRPDHGRFALAFDPA